MNRNLFRSILLSLPLLVLPAAARAVPPPSPAFSGPPADFVGFDASVGPGKAYLKLDLAKAGRFTGILNFVGMSHNVIHGTLDVSGSFSGIATPSQTPYTLLLVGSTSSTYELTGTTPGENIVGFPFAYMKGQ
jgi:hypothetical protein